MVVAVARSTAPHDADDPYFYMPAPSLTALHDFMTDGAKDVEFVEFAFFERFIDANEFMGNPDPIVNFMGYWSFEAACTLVEQYGTF